MSEAFRNAYLLSFNDPNDVRAGTSYVKADNFGFVIGGSGSVNFSKDIRIFTGLKQGENAIGTSVAGGHLHSVCSVYGFIGGGFCNLISGLNTTIGGGCNNRAIGNTATVGGGRCNCAIGNNTIIGGGHYNIARGVSSTIGGGCCNRAVCCGATVGG